MSIRNSTTVALVASDLDYSAGPPSEFRIFRFGPNKSEKGTFIFDEESALSVMREYADHGKPLLIDYNHGAALEAPTPEQALSAGEFTPEVRDGELWATNVKWTPRARMYLDNREYRLFSPLFQHDSGRVTRLLNVALTNLPALDNIAPLVAASAAGKVVTSLATKCGEVLSKAIGDRKIRAEQREGVLASALTLTGGTYTDDTLAYLAAYVETCSGASVAASTPAKLTAPTITSPERKTVMPMKASEFDQLISDLRTVNASGGDLALVRVQATIALDGIKKDTAALSAETKRVAKMLGIDPLAMSRQGAKPQTTALSADQKRAANLLGIPEADFATHVARG